MHYEEKIIEGVLMFRHMPSSGWEKCSNTRMNAKIVDQANQIAELNSALSSISGAEKKPRAFYYCEGLSAFVPLDDDFTVEDCLADLGDGAETTLRVMRKDMTDSEYAAMPEAG